MEGLSKLKLLQRFTKAVKSGNVDKVRWLVQVEGVDPNVPISHPVNGMTALHVALSKDDMALAQYLVEEAHCDVERTNQFGRTALHMACSSNLLSMIRYLVETRGANLEARDRYGLTPLHCACYMGRTDILEYLVEQQQANVDAKDKEGFTPLDKAISSLYDIHPDEDNLYLSVDIIRFLLPRTSSIAKKSLVSLWIGKPCPDQKIELHLDILSEALEKYALGHGLASDFQRFPIHTLISHFPYPSTKRLRDCISLFPTSALSLLDEQGKLPIHVALKATNQLVASSVVGVVAKSVVPIIVSILFDIEPRSALARDPCTGLYPHETAAGLASREEDDDGWLDVVFKMFRLNPHQMLRSRRGGGGFGV